MTWIVGLLFGMAGATEEEEEELAPAASAPKMRMEMAFDSMGVTAGGAQDIGYFRDRVAAGDIPHAAVFTPEGLFGEHDLPITGEGRCAGLLCPVAAGTEARLIAQPEVRWLAQLGFDTGIDARSWKREPVNLVAVVDKSGSMSGDPIEAVKQSLHAVASQLLPGDQLSIVLYGADVHTHLAATAATDRATIGRAIDAIAISGSTNLEAGLVHGFDLARQSAKSFRGVSRVMLFTDERPNTGRTDAASFMGLAETGSRDGIGMTTVGVGEQFGAELATKVSSVRGGNLFFFPDASTMRTTFADEFDTMITELAYDVALTVRAAEGLSIAGVYGIPGDAVSWGPDGSLNMTVSTLFLSREEGAIYFGLAPSSPGARTPTSLASISLDYSLRDGTRERSVITARRDASPEAGLVRGAMLVDEVTVFKAASALHHEKNDQEGAYQLVHELAGRWAGNADPDLQNEQTLIGQLEARLALLSGHQGEAPALSMGRNGVTGLPSVR